MHDDDPLEQWKRVIGWLGGGGRRATIKICVTIHSEYLSFNILPENFPQIMCLFFGAYSDYEQIFFQLPILLKKVKDIHGSISVLDCNSIIWSSDSHKLFRRFLEFIYLPTLMHYA